MHNVKINIKEYINKLKSIIKTPIELVFKNTYFQFRSSSEQDQPSQGALLQGRRRFHSPKIPGNQIP